MRPQTLLQAAENALEKAQVQLEAEEVLELAEGQKKAPGSSQRVARNDTASSFATPGAQGTDASVNMQRLSNAWGLPWLQNCPILAKLRAVCVLCCQCYPHAAEAGLDGTQF